MLKFPNTENILKTLKMKKFKIIETRTKLTNEQIKQGMDFNKIKTNAALAKSSFLKSLIAKGLLGVVAISTIVLLYKNVIPSITEEKQITPVDTAKINTLSENSNSANYEKEATNEKPIALDENKSTNNIKVENTVVPIPLETDASKINSIATYKKGVKKNMNTNRSDEPKVAERKNNSYNPHSFTASLGEDDLKEVNKSFAKINEKLYASKYEVTNKLYMTFLKSLRQSGNANLISVAEIDTLKWIDKLSYNEPYVHYYHIHPAYNNFPVVNISYEGAKLFCEWLTVQYNAAPKRKFKKVSFRLPSEEEWIIAAQAGNSNAIYPWGGKELRNKKGQYLANFKSDRTGELLVDGKHVSNGDITAPVDTYSENDF